MMKMGLIKSFSKSSIVSELVALNKKFISILSEVNNYFENNMPSEALKSFENIKIITEKIDECKKKLSSVKDIEKDNLTPTLRQQQIDIEKLSNKTQYLMEVHLELARSISNFMKNQLAKERQSDMGYNSAGTINSSIEAYRPVAYINEI